MPPTDDKIGKTQKFLEALRERKKAKSKKQEFLAALKERKMAKEAVSKKKFVPKKKLSLEKLPEDVEGVIKKMVGDPNRAKRMERFKTQMKGLKKVIKLLEDLEDRKDEVEQYVDRMDYNGYKFRIGPYLNAKLPTKNMLPTERADVPEFILDIKHALLSDAFKVDYDEYIGHYEGEARYVMRKNERRFNERMLSDYIELLEGIAEAGERAIKGINKDTTLLSFEEVNPYYGLIVSYDQASEFENIFAFRLSIDSEVDYKYEDDEDRDEADDEDREYDYIVYGRFITE